MTDLHPLLAARYSPRAYDADHKLDGAELRLLLEAARWAPSSRNGQPWRFLTGRRGSETFDGIAAGLIDSNQSWARNAAALVVGAADTGASTSAYDLGLAVGHLVVQAGALGLHARQMGGFYAERLVERFGIPDGFAPLVVVAVGRLGEVADLPEKLQLREAEPRERRPLAETAFEGEWGSPALF